MDDDRPAKKAEWLTPRRARVQSLFIDGQMRKRAIAKKLQMPRSTVQDILNSSTTRRGGKARSGRPPKLSHKDVDNVLAFLGKSFSRRILPWNEIIKECNLDVSDNTLRRALAKRGYRKCVACPKPFISESAQQQRLEFIAEHKDWTWQWQDVL